MRIATTMSFILLLWFPCITRAQDTTSVLGKITNFPSKFFSRISKKTADLDKQLDKQTEKYLQRLTKQETKLKQKLYKVDSNASKNLFLSNPQQQYESYLQKLKTDSLSDPKKLSGQYLPYADSLQGSLAFLNKNPQLLSSTNVNSPDLQSATSQLQQLQAKMQNAGQIQQYIQQRKEQIKQYLMQLAHIPPGISNIYNNYNKEQYYYTQQIEAYKEALDDPDELFKKVLGILDKLPVFQNFIKNNSILASLFPTPGNLGTPMALAGLQTRDNITQLLQGQLSGPNAMAAFSQNMSDAQSQLSQLKDKLASFGQGGENVDVPNFKPNQQKTKTLLKRLECGINLQTQHATNFFPTTTDLGLSVGYKINDKSTIGVGASYKMGWGTDMSHINLSGQGVGLRSYLDIKAKGSIYLTGGFEYNYQQPFDLADFPGLKSWQQSGLIGLSKIISLNTKVLKKTKVQLLWDFLSYQQVPKAQAFIFRVGYGF